MERANKQGPIKVVSKHWYFHLNYKIIEFSFEIYIFTQCLS